jgi:hypothetical protein
MPSAGLAAPIAPGAAGAAAVSAGNPPGSLPALEARAAALSKQYRGELVMLTQAAGDAKLSSVRAQRLRRQLGQAHQEVARLAAASYMGAAPDPAMMLTGGSPQSMLDASATLLYLSRQRGARERAVRRFMIAELRAEQTAQAKVVQLRQLVTRLEAQRRNVDALMAKFRPQSPVIGPNITPRMQAVKDAVDTRFGPFSAIGCYRPEPTGEHGLGRACDFMLSTGGVMPTAANIVRGYNIAAWAQANASRLGIMYIIYRQKIWDIRMASAGWVPMADRGSITANHYDHVHISVF